MIQWRNGAGETHLPSVFKSFMMVASVGDKVRLKESHFH